MSSAAMWKHVKRKTKTKKDEAVCTGEKLAQTALLFRTESEKQENLHKFGMNFYKNYSFLKNILISGKVHDRMSLVLKVV